MLKQNKWNFILLLCIILLFISCSPDNSTPPRMKVMDI